MRKKIVAGNWKMNLSLEQGKTHAQAISDCIKDKPLANLNGSPQVVFFTPFIHLADVAGITHSIDSLYCGAQNCYTEEKGAFTGEISAEMIASTGAEYVLIGHSERRAYFGESNEVLAKKVEIGLKHKLTPMYCCGEVLEERNNETHFDVVKEQIEKALFWLDAHSITQVVVAYEPVWAIGTGVTASPEQAQEMHAYIRSLFTEKYGKEIAEQISILYGGSCNAQNAKELFGKPDVDGGLIGGASLKVEDFCTIIKSF